MPFSITELHDEYAVVMVWYLL